MARRINTDKPHLWKTDIAASVDQFNQWFMRVAPEAFRSTRIKTTERVKAALIATHDLRNIDPNTLRANPSALSTLRMCTAPPLAVDRLVGLASASKSLTDMEAGTYTFRMNLAVGKALKVNIPVDVVIQPKNCRKDRLPILIEAKSAGDFTNTNKRRKEEATKIHQLQVAYGKTVPFVLFLCGYFGSDYLGYEAAEGIDWVWEHRIDDLVQVGL